MGGRKQAREALAEDLRALAEDLKAFVEDPKKRARKEQQWRLLYGVIALGATVASRRIATRAWKILTGEQPPTKGGQPQAPQRERATTSPGAGR
jgi:hypothetical protein